jgi:hypothetical protein
MGIFFAPIYLKIDKSSPHNNYHSQIINLSKLKHINLSLLNYKLSHNQYHNVKEGHQNRDGFYLEDNIESILKILPFLAIPLEIRMSSSLNHTVYIPGAKNRINAR